MKQSVNASVHVVLSIAAMIIVLLLVSAKYPGRQAIDETARLFVGGVFIASCAFGISLAIRPNWHKRNSSSSHNRPKQSRDSETERSLRGHHPDCAFFDSHRLVLRSRTVCAGCFGILVGALLAIVITVGYTTLARDGIGDATKILALAGLAIILMAFLETALPQSNSLAHVAANASFIVALFLPTVGLLEITSNGFVGLLGILFAYLWMDTRVRLSAWRHSLVCGRCSRSCKMY